MMAPSGKKVNEGSAVEVIFVAAVELGWSITSTEAILMGLL